MKRKSLHKKQGFAIQDNLKARIDRERGPVTPRDDRADASTYETDPDYWEDELLAKKAAYKIYNGPAAKRRAKIRGLMSRRVSPVQRAYTTRISYTRCTQQYTGGIDQEMFSGSSFNRKKRIRAKRWQINMRGVLSKWGRGKTRHREGIVWATVGGHRIRERYDPGIRVQARQKIYAAISATGFDFLPDAKEKKIDHFFSARGKNNCASKSKAFWRVAQHFKTFGTFTFIQHIEDKAAMKCWNKFLTVARREIPGLHVVKVAEHQPENPLHTIHFHCIFNRFIDVPRFNGLWVEQQYNMGLVGHRADGSVITMAEIVDHINAGTVHEVLGPFQIEKAETLDALANYITKYISKTDEREPFGCRPYSCSHKISKLFTTALTGRSTFAYLQRFPNYVKDYKTGECWQPFQYSSAFFSVIRVNNSKLALPALAAVEEVNRWIFYEDFKPDKIPRMTDDQYYQQFIKQKRTPAQLRHLLARIEPN